jgi:uncharacterized protein Yka (UPF0111/DUF47 family)
MTEKTYRLGICLEEGVVLHVKAKSVQEAEEKADEIASEYAGTLYPSEFKPSQVHRDWFVQDVKEI